LKNVEREGKRGEKSDVVLNGAPVLQTQQKMGGGKGFGKKKKFGKTQTTLASDQHHKRPMIQAMTQRRCVAVEQMDSRGREKKSK